MISFIKYYLLYVIKDMNAQIQRRRQKCSKSPLNIYITKYQAIHACLIKFPRLNLVRHNKIILRCWSSDFASVQFPYYMFQIFDNRWTILLQHPVSSKLEVPYILYTLELILILCICRRSAI